MICPTGAYDDPQGHDVFACRAWCYKKDPTDDVHGDKTRDVGDSGVDEDDVFATDLAGVGEDGSHVSPESSIRTQGISWRSCFRKARDSYGKKYVLGYDYKKLATSLTTSGIECHNSRLMKNNGKK